MYKKIIGCFCVLVLLVGLCGCGQVNKTPKVGVSFGVGQASRWVNEKAYMEERAKELGIDFEARLNTTDEPKTQTRDCKEMIDSGIDVLILTPRNASDVAEICDYAAEKKVKVISYARVVLGQSVDLFVGYDSNRIGQTMGQYLTELVYNGDYIILRGDANDNNAELLNDGVMRYIDPIRNDINIILEADVPGWSADEAKQIVKEAVAKNGNKVDAILAPNDKIAGACREALTELGVTNPVVITGMDSELDAAQRVVAGTQSMTIYMNLKDLAYTAVDQAYNMALDKEVEVNAEFDNQSQALIDANLITGQVVVKENIDNILIDSGYYTREQVYGAE